MPFAFFPSLPINESSHGFAFCQHLELSVLDFSHPHRYIMASHYCFNLQFSNGIWHWVTFRMLICYLVLIITKVLIISKRKRYKTSNDSEESVWIFQENLLVTACRKSYLTPVSSTLTGITQFFQLYSFISLDLVFSLYFPKKNARATNGCPLMADNTPVMSPSKKGFSYEWHPFWVDDSRG